MSRYCIKYVNPTVKLIHGGDSMPLAVKLWDESREELEVEENHEDKVLSMGLQYINFPTFTFEIIGSVMFRDILFTINKAAQWATSLRFKNSTFKVFNSENYPVSSEYRGSEPWERQFDTYMDKIVETSVTDVNRLEMPYSVSSKFWVQMNFKTLIAFLTMLKKRMPFYYQTYGPLFEDCFTSIDLTKYYTPYIDASMEQYFYQDECLWTTTEDVSEMQQIGDTIILHKTIGLLLYSQFIRQQDSQVKGLFSLLRHSDVDNFKNVVQYSGTPVNVWFVSDKSRVMRTIANRTCAFSMSGGSGINSWSSILDLWIKDMNLEDFEKLIPCNIKNNCITCKFWEVMKYRFTGQEMRSDICGLACMNRKYLEDRAEKDKTELTKKYLELFDVWEKKGVKPVQDSVIENFNQRRK